jgi:mono/diheme cytochrome c family protein
MRKVAIIATFLMLSACGDTPETPPTGSPAIRATSGHMPFVLTAEQAEGWVIYETMCWTCHGAAGRGDGPAVQAGTTGAPPSFHTPDYARSSAEAIERRFRGGVAGGDPGHPHMTYVASLLQPEHFIHALSFIPVLVYPPEIPGSAVAGKTIYDFRCAGCHGLEGTGEGAGAGAESFITIRPADFTSDSLIANKDWDALYRRVSEGAGSIHSASMPQWSVVLSESEIWDVVSFLATFQEGVLRPPYWMEP